MIIDNVVENNLLRGPFTYTLDEQHKLYCLIDETYYLRFARRSLFGVIYKQVLSLFWGECIKGGGGCNSEHVPASDCNTPAGLRNWREARTRVESVVELICLCWQL